MFLKQLSVKSYSICRSFMDDHEYYKTRTDFLSKPTALEYATAARVAQQLNTTQQSGIAEPLVPRQHLQLTSKNHKLDTLIVHFTYEQRFAPYKRTLHQVWNTNFFNTPILHTKLIVGTKNILNLTRELVRRSPYDSKSTKVIRNLRQHKNRQKTKQLKHRRQITDIQTKNFQNLVTPFHELK